MDFAALTRDYGDVDGEAAACRTDAALFDFSFMSRGKIAGPAAADAIQSLTPRPLDVLRPGRIFYAVRVDRDGHACADLTIWRIGAEAFEVYSGRPDEMAALPAEANCSARTCILAIQGPGSLRALRPLAGGDGITRLAYFEHAEAELAGVPCRVGRLGYTGERGFEIVAPADAKATLWTSLSTRARPAGFAAADVLRIEAGFVLFANEFRPGVSPAEAGLARFGGASGTARVELTGFTAECDARPVLYAPGPDLRVPPGPGEIAVTSAGQSAQFGVIGLGYVRAGERGNQLVDRSGRFRNIRRARVPFFDPLKRRVRGSWRADLMPEYSQSRMLIDRADHLIGQDFLTSPRAGT